MITERKDQEVALDVLFKCETCKKEIVQVVKIRPNFALCADQFPEGWKTKIEEHELKVWCPSHSLSL